MENHPQNPEFRNNPDNFEYGSKVQEQMVFSDFIFLSLVTILFGGAQLIEQFCLKAKAL